MKHQCSYQDLNTFTLQMKLTNHHVETLTPNKNHHCHTNPILRRAAWSCSISRGLRRLESPGKVPHSLQGCVGVLGQLLNHNFCRGKRNEKKKGSMHSQRPLFCLGCDAHETWIYIRMHCYCKQGALYTSESLPHRHPSESIPSSRALRIIKSLKFKNKLKSWI